MNQLRKHLEILSLALELGEEEIILSQRKFLSQNKDKSTRKILELLNENKLLEASIQVKIMIDKLNPNHAYIDEDTAKLHIKLNILENEYLEILYNKANILRYMQLFNGLFFLEVCPNILDHFSTKYRNLYENLQNFSFSQNLLQLTDEDNMQLDSLYNKILYKINPTFIAQAHKAKAQRLLEMLDFLYLRSDLEKMESFYYERIKEENLDKIYKIQNLELLSKLYLQIKDSLEDKKSVLTMLINSDAFEFLYHKKDLNNYISELRVKTLSLKV